MTSRQRIREAEEELERLRQEDRATRAARDEQIRAATGTNGQIARRFGLSVERVRQIRRFSHRNG